MITRQTSLSKNIVQFCRFLRQKLFTLSVEEEVTALNSLQFIDYSNKDVFRLALKSVLCKNQNQIHEFESLFNQYWKETDEAIDSKLKTQIKHVSTLRAKDTPFKSLKEWLNATSNNETEQIATYSINESLSQKDFSSVPADDLDELMRSIKTLSKRLAAHVSRRYEKSNKVNLPDLRRTLRMNMRRGGELLEIAFRKSKPNRMNLVVLCDVSKSMDLYSAFLLQFMYAFQQVYSRMETFAFGTSLQRITHLFKQNDFKNSLHLLSGQSKSWSGGTRIGASLNSFVQDYARRLLNKRTIVIILSDGWDTGDTHLLSQSMEVIHKTAKKVIWLNPLAGYISYRPEVGGMQAALPYIDVFAPVHNLDSLRSLGRWL